LYATRQKRGKPDSIVTNIQSITIKGWQTFMVDLLFSQIRSCGEGLNRFSRFPRRLKPH
jgi:hypothetical protein